MADLHGFNAHEIEPSSAFDPLPSGDYLCVITASTFKPTKSGDGNYLELELEVLTGPYQGRKLWDRLNLHNANDLTVKIARGTLSAICRATGVMQPKDSCELHDIPLLVKVAVKKRNDTDELTNVIKAYRKREGTAGPGVATGSKPASVPSTPSGSSPVKPTTPPWKRTAPAPTPEAQAEVDVPF